MNDMENSTPNIDLARASEMGIELARALDTYHKELLCMGDETISLRYAASSASRDLMRESLILPGIRISITPLPQKESK